MRFSKRNCIFCLFYVGEIETEKRQKHKMEKGKKTLKIVFSKVVIRKIWIFSKNCLTRQEGRESALFRAHYLFRPCFGPKQWKPGNTIKIVVSVEIAQTKNDTFFLKKVFLTWVKKWVLLTVFLKSCVLLKTLFFSVSEKHSSCNDKTVCWKKKEDLWKIVGCFWTWQNGVFGLFFWGFYGFVLGFLCVW